MDTPPSDFVSRCWRHLVERAHPAGWRGLGLLLGGIAAPSAHALGMASLKSAIVYNLLLFVEWPVDVLAADASTVTLCVEQGGADVDSLRALASRPVGSRTLEVRGVSGAADSLRGCHAWYRHTAPAPAPAPATATRQQLQQTAVLTIGPGEHRHDDATVIHLVEVNGRMAFDVDTSTARQHRLQLSSKLLRLARQVHE